MKKLTKDALTLLKAVKTVEEMKEIYGQDSVIVKNYSLIESIWRDKENTEILVKMGLVELKPSSRPGSPNGYIMIVTEKGEEALEFVS